jgi:hypothetical protein
VPRAESAADAPPAAAGLGSLARLAHEDPSALRLALAPGAALLVSRYPVATIWQAHRSDAPDRFAAVRAAFAAGRGQTCFVWRAGWRASVAVVADADRAFVAAVCAGATLDAALDAVVDASADDGGDAFDVTRWLGAAVAAGWIAGVTAAESSNLETSRS